jgi:hypothetical protein
VALVVLVVGDLVTEWSVDKVVVGVGADGGQERPHWGSSVGAGGVDKGRGAGVSRVAMIELCTLNKLLRVLKSVYDQKRNGSFSHLGLGSVVAVSILIDAVNVACFLRLGLERVTLIVLERAGRAQLSWVRIGGRSGAVVGIVIVVIVVVVAVIITIVSDDNSGCREGKSEKDEVGTHVHESKRGVEERVRMGGDG